MRHAESPDPGVWTIGVPDVANAPGTVCNIYADCIKLLNQGKKINYQGAAVTAGFDKYRNTFGDWLVTQVGSDGTTQNGILKVSASAAGPHNRLRLEGGLRGGARPHPTPRAAWVH